MLRLKYIEHDRYVKRGHYFGNALEVQDELCHYFLELHEGVLAKDEDVCRYLWDICRAEWDGFTTGSEVTISIDNKLDDRAFRSVYRKSITCFAYEIQLTMQLIYFSKFDRPLVLTELFPAVDDLFWLAKNMDITLYIKESKKHGFPSLFHKFRVIDCVDEAFVRTNNLLDIEWKGEHFFDCWEFERLIDSETGES